MVDAIMKFGFVAKLYKNERGKITNNLGYLLWRAVQDQKRLESFGCSLICAEDWVVLYDVNCILKGD